jgi:hypothetical protein
MRSSAILARRAFLLGAILGLTVFAIAQTGPNTSGLVVIVPVANMYSRATLDADVVSQAIYGTTVTLLEEKEGWVKVKTPDDYPGWIESAMLRRLAADEKAYASSGKIAHVDNLSANLYREPSVTRHAPMITVPFETRMEVIAPGEGRSQSWLQVRLPDGRFAWIQAGDVTVDPKPLSIEECIGLAKKFLGVTYTWGGMSSFGYDCSGFMEMLIRHRGIIMPRDANLQAGWSGAVKVERNELQPGDLLYFGASTERITHTGMYIGNGEFIHDTTNAHPMVQISRLDDQPWTKLLVVARRVKQ